MSLSPAAAVPGGTVTLNLTLNSAGTTQPAAIEWTTVYSTGDFTSINVAAGPAANSAGKSISCNPGTGSINCLLFGLNENSMGTGVIATITFTVSSTTADTSSAVQIANPSATDAAGNTLAITGGAGTVTITPPVSLTALACSPNPLTTPGTALCSVTSSAPAPGGGLSVSLGVSGNSSALSMPGSVAIGLGAVTAQFSASAAAVSAATTPTIVASLNGSSQDFALQLAPPPPAPPPAPPAPATITALACNPTVLSSNTSSTCTVTLSGAAPSAGSIVLIALTSQASLTMPASVTVPGGTTGASFSVHAGSIGSSQTTTVQSTLNGSSAGCVLTLQASVKHRHH